VAGVRDSDFVFQESGLAFQIVDIALFSLILSLSDPGKGVLYSKSAFFDWILFVFSFGNGFINCDIWFYIPGFGVF